MREECYGERDRERFELIRRSSSSMPLTAATNSRRNQERGHRHERDRDAPPCREPVELECGSRREVKTEPESGAERHVTSTAIDESVQQTSHGHTSFLRQTVTQTRQYVKHTCLNDN